MRCPLCHVRPARRGCPALGQNICSVCCGTKRQAEIRCPDSCVYLSSARSHPAAVVRRQQEADLAALVPALRDLSDSQQQLFLLSVTLVDKFRGTDLIAAADDDVAEAAGALASTYETAAKGVIYEHRAGALAAQRLASELKTVFDELGRSRPTAFAADAALVLRALEHLVQRLQRGPGAGPRAFLEIAGRIARQFAEGRGARESAQGNQMPSADSSLVLP